MESSERREALRTILTEVLETRTSLVRGSSGSAEANSQSSLLELLMALLLLAPFVGCCA